MKKELLFGFDFARRHKMILDSAVIESSITEVEIPQSPKDSLIQLIYAPDERTNLPTGDLSYWVSDSVNPQIKDFILKNLLFDTSSAASPSIPDGLDDSLAFDLSRQRDESLESYVNRINEFGLMNKQILESAKQSVSPRESEPAVVAE